MSQSLLNSHLLSRGSSSIEEFILFFQVCPLEFRIMSISLAAILAFAYILAYTSDEAYAMPAEKDVAGGLKEVKEPKEIKEAAAPSKDVKDAIKAAKEAKKNKKECLRDCGTSFDPICAHDPSDATVKPRTFGTQCAMEVANCEMGSKFVVKSKGECPGSSGVRLS